MARARTAAMGTGTMLTGSSSSSNNNSSIMMAMIHNGARMTTICGDLVGAVLLKTSHALPRCVRSGEGREVGHKILPYKQKIIPAYEHRSLWDRCDWSGCWDGDWEAALLHLQSLDVPLLFFRSVYHISYMHKRGPYEGQSSRIQQYMITGRAASLTSTVS